jgi:hypothetical protein
MATVAEWTTDGLDELERSRHVADVLVRTSEGYPALAGVIVGAA